MAPLLAHFLLLTALSGVAAWRLCRGTADRILATFILAWTNVVVTGLALSFLSRLGHADWFLRSSVGLAVVTALAVRRLVAPPADAPEAMPPDDPLNQPLAAALGLSFLALLGASTWVAASYAPNNYDSLTYHLSRVMFYLGQDSLAHFDTTNARQVYFPFNFNLLQAAVLIYSPPAPAVNFLNLLTWLVSGVAIFRLTRACGCRLNAALLATWLALTSTQVLAQATATTNDLPTAAAVLATLVFVLRWTRTASRRDAVLAGAALGLTLGTKLTVVFFFPVAGLLALLGGWRHRSTLLPRAWPDLALAAVVAVVLAAPFAVYNLAAKGQWMTHEYDFTRNQPFSFACSVQTGAAYLLQLFIEPLHRFSFDFGVTAELNTWAARTFFPHWNEAYAFSPLYIFPPDLNEDHVWYGFAGPLLLLGALVCVWRDRRLLTPAAWLAVLGLGWLAVYFALNKWSLYNQRYFVPAILLLAPALGVTLDRGWSPRGFVRSAAGLLTGLVALTSLWFAANYLGYNSNRPLMPLITAAPGQQVVPGLPPALEQELAAQSRLNFQSDGSNERIYLLMNLARHQRISSHRRVDPDSYNVFSHWSYTRDAVFSNITNGACHTLVAFPGKPTAGVRYLGTIGDDVDANDYYGLPAQPGTKPADDVNRNLLVSLYYRRNEPDRFANTTVRLSGLNAEDHTVARLVAELPGGGTLPLATFNATGEARFSLTQPFTAITLLLVQADTGRELARGSLPVRVKQRAVTSDQPTSRSSLFVTELILPSQSRALPQDGLAEFEGPYFKWDLPLFRWAKKPTVRITVPANPQLKRIRVSISVRLHVRDHAQLALVHNGRTVQEFRLDGQSNWHDIAFDLVAAPGANVIELADIPDNAAPDWKAYLDQNPDVKAFLESQHASMELGAQNHYETKGRFEHRPLPKSRSPLPPAGQGFFYIYRSLRLEGFSTP